MTYLSPSSNLIHVFNFPKAPSILEGVSADVSPWLDSTPEEKVLGLADVSGDYLMPC